MFGLGKEIDAVCKMKVTKDVQFKSEYQGKIYYFCALNCKKDFDKNPGKYAK